MNIENVYELLNVKSRDPYVVSTNQFILQPHQVIPKYYMFSNGDADKLIINASLGSGKTSLAVFALLYKLDQYRMFKFIEAYSASNNAFVKHNRVNRNVIVIGSWQTKNQFETELLRPEFHIVSEDVVQKINQLLKSPLESDRLEGEEMRKKEILKTAKDIQYYGYQAFFNAVFPGISSEKYNQNINALILELERGTLKMSEEFLKQAANSIIIVDEMQRLYSYMGLNTYGFAVACVAKKARAHGIYMMFLTGTMLNTSLSEVPDILSIISNSNKFYARTDFCHEETILNDVSVWRIDKEKLKSALDIFNPKFINYNVSSDRVKSNIFDISNLPQNIFFPKNFILLDKVYEEKFGGQIIPYESKSKKEHCNALNAPLKYILYPGSEIIPTEIHIGNRNVSEANVQMLLYSVSVQGLQAQKYSEYLSVHQEDSELNELETDMSISIHDAFIPDSKEWIDHGIYDSNGVLWGNFLSLNKIRKYSALGYEMCKLCLLNTFNNEKTVIYHNKLNSFGIKQYAAILQFNGFIKAGSSPTLTSLCKSCRHTYKDHSLPLEERINKRICNTFAGMYYDILSGDVDMSQRESITNTIFNNPNNVYGEILSILFVSDVAYSGISFFNTNNIIILSRIPNISKWKQIYARIIRTKSHAGLPKAKQYAKVYTMTIEHPNEIKLRKNTHEEKYYRIRIILNNDIETFTKYIAENSIGNILLSNPSEYKLTQYEQRITTEMFISDIENEMNLIIKYIMNDDVSAIWKMDTIVKRIKDSKLSVTYLDLSRFDDEFIVKMLVRSNMLTVFQYENSDVWYIKLKQNTSINSNIDKNINTFQFSQLSNINLERNNFNNTIRYLESEKSYANKIIILTKLIKSLKHKYTILAENDVFWNAIYDIGDEYYPDDETNFFYNHMLEHRNISKMAGCYYGQIIILKTGFAKTINYSFPIVNGIKGMPFKFKISCLMLNETTPFYIHVNVIKIIENSAQEVLDRRRTSKGLVCTSSNTDELIPFFPKIDKTFKKKQFCRALLYEICAMQNAHPEEKFVYTPFEK